jgi:hydrogenase maturation protease
MPDRSRVAIVGVGNAMMGDDGVGVRALETIRQMGVPEHVLLVEVGTSSLDSLDMIVNTGKLIVVDAVRGGSSPGTIYRLRPQELVSGRYRQLSLHQISLLDSLELALIKGRIAPDVIIIGVEPKTVAPGSELSPELEARLSDIALAAIEEAVAWRDSRSGF